MDGTVQQRAGILSIYKQDWALTRYVDRLRSFFPDLLVLGEELPSLRENDPLVKRCWKRGSNDYNGLRTILLAEKITVLHINCCYPFFDNPQFYQLLEELKRTVGLRIVAHVHDASALYSVRELLCDISDAVIVDSQRARLHAIIGGVAADRIEVLPNAVDATVAVPAANSSASRERLLVGFDFGASTEKLEELFRAIYDLNPARAKVRLAVVQLDAPKAGMGVPEPLARKIASLNLEGYIEFIQRSDLSAAVEEYLGRADVVVLSASRPLIEVREVLGMALLRGTPVVSNAGLPFDELEGAVFSVQPESAHAERSLAGALEMVLNQPTLRDALSAGAEKWAERYGAAATQRALTELMKRLNAAAVEPSAQVTTSAVVRRGMKILMQNRSNAFTQPGGDTIVMERLSRELIKLGHTVDLDVECRRDPREYDLVHLYNFAIREATEAMARRCRDAGAPYVVTTLYEDWPVFYNQMANLYYTIKAYVDAGQPQEHWAPLLTAARQVEPSPAWDNRFAAENAEALLASGEYERQSLLRDYPNAKRVDICHFGSEVTDLDDGGELFRRTTGLSDFVLMVGRLEWRKNQLMLLKALEDTEHTIVFAAGGFTYQPEYEALCRAFKRRGKTVFLGRLEPQMLASAFGAARVHALPSWFELPGLVSMEAARYGANVVATEFGTARDYLGSEAFYCRPDDDETIRQAVEAAYAAPRSETLREAVRAFTWERAAQETAAVYEAVLNNLNASSTQQTAPPPQVVTTGIRSAERESHEAKEAVARIPEVIGQEERLAQSAAEGLCAEGDSFAAQGNITAASSRYKAALAQLQDFARAHRSLGVMALGSRSYAEARQHFRDALKIDPQDGKALTGLGSAEWELGNREEAFDIYLRACDLDDQAGPLPYLVSSAYALGKLAELEQVLRRYLRHHRENLNMQYCLAGCYFRQKKHSLASGIAERILQVEPDHRGALELRDEILRLGGIAPAAMAPVTTAAEDAQPLTVELERLEAEKKRRQYDDVIAGADAILSRPGISPDERAQAKLLKAEALACSGKMAEAHAEFQPLLEDAAWKHRALTGTAALTAAQGRYADAADMFRQALTAKPRYDVALAGLGVCAQGEGDLEKAWSFFEEAFTANPENNKALYGLIQLGYSLKRLEQTERAIRTYLELRPVDLAIVYSLAGCLYARGEREEAIEQCRKILLFEPDHALALELLEKLEAPTQKSAAALG